MKTMRLLFSAIILLSAILFISCNDENGNEQEIKLSETSINSYSHIFHEIGITGGSGKYSVNIDIPIAEVNIQTEDTGNILIIQTVGPGEAIITVTDEITGKSAICSLKITVRSGKDRIVDVQYGVDAEQKEIILAELEETNPFPLGSFVTRKNLTNQDMQWTINAPDNTILADGILSVADENNFPGIYNLVPVKEQIYLCMKYSYENGNIKSNYDAYIVRGKHTRFYMQPPQHIRFYEDLTEYYKVKYPDADVKGVIRVYFFQYQLED